MNQALSDKLVLYTVCPGSPEKEVDSELDCAGFLSGGACLEGDHGLLDD